MRHFLPFESSVQNLDGQINELRRLEESAQEPHLNKSIASLEKKRHQLLVRLYAQLSPWQKTLVARHPHRPHFLDYVNGLVGQFTPLSGDRYYGEDGAIIGGLGRFRSHNVMIIGNEKGHDTQTRVEHNFGMARPEGYRKACRLMRLAEKFSLPIITLVDTAGAFPGADAEARGQAESIAQSIKTCLDVKVPLICAIIGEGGSGGALALASANTIIMMEHATYSVISPEGCASILWRDDEKSEDAANILKLTAQNLMELNVIDEIVKEPVGAAHRDPHQAIKALGNQLEKSLKSLLGVSGTQLRTQRHNKFLHMTRMTPS